MSDRAATPPVLATLAVVAVTALVGARPAPSAQAYERQPALERVVERLARVPAEVRCPTSTEWVADPIWGGGSDVSRGWAYTHMLKDYVVVHPLLCAAAARVADSGLAPAERAAGVLVVVHEAHHVRRWRGRWSEAKVECQAIRGFKRGAQLLGASAALANELLPYALALHLRMGARFREYADPKCRLPVWAPPFAP